MKEPGHYLHCHNLMRYLVLWACISTLAACSVFRPATDSQSWPDNLPDRDYFEAVYEADPVNRKLQSKQAYLTWIMRFYQGSAIYRRGWKDLVPDIIDGVEPPEKRHALKRQLASIGKKIAADWAKDNSVRQITTAHLATWGQAMNESVLRNEQVELVEQIDRDVNRLLQNKLKPQSIVANRYYPEDENDVFR